MLQKPKQLLRTTKEDMRLEIRYISPISTSAGGGNTLVEVINKVKTNDKALDILRKRNKNNIRWAKYGGIIIYDNVPG